MMAHFLTLILALFCVGIYSSILGIDFGDSSYKMVLTPEGKRKQMQLMFNEQSSRKTDTVIGFRGEERLFGSFANNNMKFSPQTSYPYLRDLLGVQSLEIAKERVSKYVSYADTLYESEHDYKQIGLKNPVTGTNYTVNELVAMIFQQAKRTAEKDSGTKIYEVCITVPSYFNVEERQALLDAANIGGLTVIALVNQGDALAITYGNEQTLTPTETKRNVVFFDFGESSLQLTLASFSPLVENKKNYIEYQILANTSELIGGRDFTEALVQHFLKEATKKSGNPSLAQNLRAISKLRLQLESTKETLSASKEATFSLANLDGEFDFAGSISRQDFEALTEEFYPRVQAALERLMSQTNLTKEDIYAVELVGGSSRIPRVQSVIKEFFGKQTMDTHMNADEAAVFGAAFYGAASSGRYRMGGVKIKDTKPKKEPKKPVPKVEPVVIPPTETATTPETTNVPTTPEANPDTTTTAEPDATNSETNSQPQANTENQPTDSQPEANSESQQQTNEANTENNNEANPETQSETNTENNNEANNETENQNGTEPTVEPIKVQIGLPQHLKEESKKVLADQDHAEALRVKNANMKNDLETMIYDMKSRVEEDNIVRVTSNEQRAALVVALNTANEWLEEEGPTANLSTSREKLKTLEKVVSPILFRVSELKALPKSIQGCTALLESASKTMEFFAETKDITEKEVESTLKDVATIQEWLSREIGINNKLKTHEDASLTSTLIDKKCNRIYKEFEKFSKRRKKPAPKKQKEKLDPHTFVPDQTSESATTPENAPDATQTPETTQTPEILQSNEQPQTTNDQTGTETQNNQNNENPTTEKKDL